MQALSIIILAAGKGTRMGTDEPKVLARTCANQTLLEHVISTASTLNPKEIIIVIGHQAEKVSALLEKLQKVHPQVSFKIALQEQQLGTGHAVKCASALLDSKSKDVLILCGDVPLVKTSSLQRLIQDYSSAKAAIGISTMWIKNSSGYGRILRDSIGNVTAIVEKKDCSVSQLTIAEGNAAIYCADKTFLVDSLSKIKNENSQKEYYLTDIIELAVADRLTVTATIFDDYDEVQGVNTQADLASVNRKIINETITVLCQQGVRFMDPDSCFIEPTVSIQKSTEIGPNVQILGNSTVAAGVVIEGNSVIKNSSIGAGALIKNFVVIEDAILDSNCQIGPFAHLRSGSKIGDSAKIGNFVETKNATLAAGVKASHLSYLGDCTIGSNTNIGAGTIFANYDGVNKHHTVVGSNSFIGSNSTLIAPLQIGQAATVGAGSVIRKDVEAESLTLTKGELVTKIKWARPKKNQ
jgi:bifunctional UDP-N-acetylglucosamine pyrophosphorylase/glucosamine-1-phosphate N-acetyltransferase